MSVVVAALPWIATAASVAGTVYSAIQSEKAGDEAERAEKRQAYMLAEQARIREENEREKARRLLATQRARIGASGVTMEGSPLLNMMETQAQYERDLLNIRQGYQWEISETLRRGEAYEETGEARAGSTLLTGLGGTASQLYGWYRKPS